MDDLAHHFPLNHRKRKADAEDHQDSSSTDQVPPPLAENTSVVSAGPSNAPRQPWLATNTDTAMWPSPSSPQISSPLATFKTYPSSSTKRPRLERIETSLRPTKRPPPRKSPVKATPPKPPPTVRHGNDVEDIGIVSTADPGPSSGSLLHLRPGPKLADPSSSTVPFIPIDTNSTHIPPLQPLINRQTLKELDLDAILRNPQLRHDLLFDPGLQFRPTSSRRKRDMSEKYWAAICQEVESGCTCVSFDSYGKPHPLVCACAQAPLPPSSPVAAYSSSLNVFTLRMPSRIRNLLSEFLEVLLLVIQPLSSIAGMYVNPNTFKSQMEEHSAQAAYIRSIFDPILIEQELKHELFDPSGLFRAIGLTLKGHCAPMRDHAVEAMVQAAQTCTPGGSGNKRDAVKCVRMCMEILELMKLDIANHQLQTLRPFLIRTSGQFELKTFKNRKDGGSSLQTTRDWLRLAHEEMLACGPITHPQYQEHLVYNALPRNQQIYLTVLKGLVDLIFEPPASSSSPLLSPIPTSPPLTPISTPPSPISPVLQGYPETTHLDNARLSLLSSDAADAIVLSMFLLLYRQLIYSDTSESINSPQDLSKVNDQDLMRLKNEIRGISPNRLGHCFPSKRSLDDIDSPQVTRSEKREAERWRATKQDIVLQIAKRANEARNRATSPRSPSSPSSPIDDAPNEQMLSLAQRWADSNIQTDSALSTMLRRRLRNIVFNAVVTLAYPGRDSTTGKLTIIDFHSSVQADPTIVTPIRAATGMEPLSDEIRALSEKISRLALIHLNAFLPLYEQEGFLEQS